jgi:hypothetical protein
VQATWNGSAWVENPVTETRSYNVRGQMTRMTAPGEVDLEYRFSAAQNDGRITQMKDWISGEEVNYQFDALGRLTSAVTTGPEWGNGFVFDGFGNLLQKNVTKGSAPALSITVNGSMNYAHPRAVKNGWPRYLERWMEDYAECSQYGGIENMP